MDESIDIRQINIMIDNIKHDSLFAFDSIEEIPYDDAPYNPLICLPENINSVIKINASRTITHSDVYLYIDKKDTNSTLVNALVCDANQIIQNSWVMVGCLYGIPFCFMEKVYFYDFIGFLFYF